MSVQILLSRKRVSSSDADLPPIDPHGAALRVVTPGEVIAPDSGYLRGHGTYIQDGNIVSSVLGVLERVNRLISVRPMKSRYVGSIGDVVVGRILSVGNGRWEVDIQSTQHAILQLSAIQLPGGVQRRRTDEDQLMMRDIYVEGDVICAEVQQHFGDGSLALQTRSSSYGKLSNGFMLQVVPSLIRRARQHFYVFDDVHIRMIMGMNGFIWIEMEEEGGEVTVENRKAMARIANIIHGLNDLCLPIYPSYVHSLLHKSSHLDPKEMLVPDNMLEIVRDDDGSGLRL